MQRARRVQEEVLNDVEQLDKNNSNVNNVKLFKNMLQKQFNDSLNVLSTEMFLSGAFPIRVVPKECSGGAQKRCGMQTEGVPKRVRVDGDRACESQFMFPT